MIGPLTSAQFAELLPLAAAWAAGQEARILAVGEPLPAGSLHDAVRLGVQHPEQVRVLAVPAIPMPEHTVLRAAGELTGLIGPQTAGMAIRYGIFVCHDLAGDRSLLAHELVHTAQYERCGGILPFLQQYLRECLTCGYPAAPLEQEAIRLSSQLREG